MSLTHSAIMPGPHLPVSLADQAYTWMQQALGLLEDCQASPDVPVAALVLSPQGEVLGIGLNRREVLGDPTAHAEVEAIRQAVKVYGDGWRLEGCTLVVTLEPCAMCAGTIMNSRVSRVIFGAYEPKTGACGSVLDVLRDPILRPNPEVIGGIAAAECSAVLEDFFQRLRGLHVTKDA